MDADTYKMIIENKFVAMIGIMLITWLFFKISKMLLNFSKNGKRIIKENYIHENKNLTIKSSLKFAYNIYKLVKDYENLQTLFSKILGDNISFGLDTEYYRGITYKGEICLFQISIPGYNNQHQLDIYIVDIILIKQELLQKYNNIDKLKETLKFVFENPKIEKIIHCTTNDSEWIYQDFDIILHNVFDTQYVYQVLNGGKIKIGLDELINKYFDVKVIKLEKKQFQKSNWKERPLTNDQLNYASQDAFYLLELRKFLSNELSKKQIDYNTLKTQEENYIKRLTVDKSQKIKESAERFLLSHCMQLGNVDFEEKKKLFIQLYEFNDNLACKNDFNPERFLSIKLIYKLILNLPHHKFEFESLIKSFEPDNLHKYENELKEVYNLILKTKEIIDKNKTLNLSPSNSKDIDILNSNTNNQKNPKLDRELRKEKVKQKFVCKGPIYENCCMLAPNDEILCYCDKKKMNWYISRGLGVQIKEEPVVFKLLFDPEGRGYSDIKGLPTESYVKNRENCCVICGAKDNFLRFHVVPIIYRQHFPTELKSHKSHDVVAACLSCHQEGNKIYEEKKTYFSKLYNVPFNIKSENEISNHELSVIIKTAKSLVRNYNSIPKQNLKELCKSVISFLNDDQNRKLFAEFFNDIFGNNDGNNKYDLVNEEIIPLELLEKIKDYKIEKSNEKNLHGKLVVEKIKDYQEFIREWRNFFIERLDPQFLPDAWEKDLLFYKTKQNYK